MRLIIFDWNLVFDFHYKKKIEDIKQYHWFGYSSLSNGVIGKRFTEAEDFSEVKQNIWGLKKKICEEEKNEFLKAIRDGFPRVEENGWLSDIKQCKLYSKWRSFVPDDFKDIICPKPPDEVLKKIDNEKKEKRKKSATAQEGQQ